MAIDFTQVPSNLRLPFIGIEIDGSEAAGSARVQPVRALIIGQQNSGAGQVANSIVRLFSASQASELFGDGSLLHQQAVAWFNNNRFTEVWAGVLDDDEAATASTRVLAFSGPATANGTVWLYINGTVVKVGVSTDDTASDVAAAVVAKIATIPGLPVTAAQGGVGNTHKVTLTTKAKGAVSAELDVRFNYRDSEAFPAGIGCAITATAGATNPDLAGLLAGIANERFDVIVCPYTDDASVSAVQAELESRWDAMRQLDGTAWFAKEGDASSLASYGDALNSQYLTFIGFNNSPSPAYQWGAARAAVWAFQAGEDPARQCTTLELRGILPPPISSRFTLEESNALLWDGFSTFTVDANKVRLGRDITTYQRDVHGSEDPAFLDVNTVLTLAWIRRDLRTRIQAKYPRHKLANDGTRIGPGQPVVTPKILKGEIISIFRDWETRGLVEDAGAFASSLLVERDETDRTRVNVLMQPNLINQFYVAGVLIQYIL